MTSHFEPPSRPPTWIAGVGIGFLAASAVAVALQSTPASHVGSPDKGSTFIRESGLSGHENSIAKDPDLRVATRPAVTRRQARGRCEGCGVIESVRQVGTEGGLEERIDAKVAAVGSRGASGRAVTAPASPAPLYEITIRFRDGSATVFTEATPRDWQEGNLVVMIGGATVADD
jgi:hypothetical protein